MVVVVVVLQDWAQCAAWVAHYIKEKLIRASMIYKIGKEHIVSEYRTICNLSQISNLMCGRINVGRLWQLFFAFQRDRQYEDISRSTLQEFYSYRDSISLEIGVLESLIVMKLVTTSYYKFYRQLAFPHSDKWFSYNLQEY